MTQQYPGSDRGTKPTKCPNTDVGERKRAPRRRPKQRNALYCLAAEFKRLHPGATAASAWAHFTALVGMDVTLIGYDAKRDALEYLPDLDRRSTRTVVRKTFFNQWFKLTRLPARPAGSD